MSRLFRHIQGPRALSFLYFFMLLYTIAALIWWGILLHQQSKQITDYKVQALRLQVDSLSRPVDYRLAMQAIEREEERRTWKYIGEGSTFLLILLVGAGFVYGAIRRQLKISQEQQNFMMAVTHELKSPIAAAKLNLEMLQKYQLDRERQSKLIQNTILEADRLNDLCNNILLAYQLESHQYRSVKEPFDFSERIRHLAEHHLHRIQTHRIEIDIEPGIWINGDPLMMDILLSNLIENAVKYAPRQTLVKISLEANDALRLRVADEGNGIPLSERKRVFQKFYRLGNENTRQAKGTGLGLYLVKKIVEQHQGQVQIMDNHPKGSVFEVRFTRFDRQ